MTTNLVDETEDKTPEFENQGITSDQTAPQNTSTAENEGAGNSTSSSESLPTAEVGDGAEKDQEVPNTWWAKIDLGIIVTVIIIAHTLFSTYISYTSNAWSGAAGKYEMMGSQANRSAGDAKAENYAAAYQHYRAFTQYAVYNGQTYLYSEDIAKQQTNPAAAKALQLKKDEATQLAMDSRAFFPAKYLQPDGTYNIKRELNELWAEEALKRNLSPDSYYAQADTLGNYSQNINWPIALMTAGLYLLIALVNALHESRIAERLVAAGIAGALLIAMIAFYFVTSSALG